MRIQKVVMFASVLPVLMITACAKYTAVENQPEAIRQTVEIGDVVSIVTKEGKKFRLEVKEMTAEAIIGEKKQVRFDDIALIKKKAIDTTKTCGCIGAGIGAGTAVTVAAYGLAVILLIAAIF